MLNFLKRLITKDPAEKEHRLQRLTRVIRMYSLSCNKCGHLSAPLLGTQDRYQCTDCGRQFVGKAHYINLEIPRKLSGSEANYGMRHNYDECVERLKVK